MARLYHGTRKLFDSFNSELIGEGWEPNSALGVWLSTSPLIAWEYAYGENLIVAETGELRLLVARNLQTTVWGGEDLHPQDREIAWPLFDAARQSLAALGYDGIYCEMPGTSLEGAVCVFDPSRLRIINTIQKPEANMVEALAECDDGLLIDFDYALEDELQRSKQSGEELRP